MKQLEIFFEWCVGCGAPGTELCSRCAESRIKYSPQRCIYCNKPSVFGLTHTACKTKNGIDGIFSLYYYKGAYSKLLKQAKYRGVHRYVSALFSSIPPQHLFCAWDIKRFFLPKKCAYVPLFFQDEKERGFNQARIIAHYVAKLIHVPVLSELVKIKKTSHQSSLNPKHRMSNVNCAFVIKRMEKLSAGNILLFDDVVTTGSTVKEITRVLKKKGYAQVYVWSLFRAR